MKIPTNQQKQLRKTRIYFICIEYLWKRLIFNQEKKEKYNEELKNDLDDYIKEINA